MARIKTHHVKIITDKFIYIEDSGIGLSITNDVDEIIRLLRFLVGYIGLRRIFYKDSFDQIDEIVLKDGKFSHFSVVSEEIKKHLVEIFRDEI